MGIRLEIVDHDANFARLSDEAVIINDIDVMSMEGKDKLNSLLYTRYEGDALNVLPSCDCGELKGEYNVGVRCDNCGSEVLPLTERPLESTLWIAAPKGVRALINPVMWTILSNAMSGENFRLLEWLCNSGYVPKNPNAGMLHRAKSLKLKRGLNNFHDNFDEIMQVVFSNKLYKGRARDLIDFVHENRDRVFCQHLPVPTKLGFITETNGSATYADSTMYPALDAIRTISSIESGPSQPPLRVKENRTAKAISQLAKYYEDFVRESLGKKEGWFRKHVFGSRTHFSFRAVINSLSDNHEYDEVHLPWGLAVSVLRAHLTNKLLALGKTPNEINKFLKEHTLVYHPLLDQLFQELIDESPYGGIPIVLQRNPTLKRGSAQALRVTRVRQEVRINTISLSTLILKAPNADFDGDEMNGLIILDHKLYEAMQALAPHNGVLDLRKPRTISNNLTIPSPVLATIGNWLNTNK